MDLASWSGLFLSSPHSFFFNLTAAATWKYLKKQTHGTKQRCFIAHDNTRMHIHAILNVRNWIKEKYACTGIKRDICELILSWW